MSASKKLAVNSLLTLIANLSLAMGQWLLLVIVAKSFSSEKLGELVLALSIASPIFMFFSFKLRSVMAVDVSKKWPSELFFVTRSITSIIAMALCLVVSYFVSPNLPIVVLITVCLFKFGDGWSELFYCYCHRSGMFSTAAIAQILRSAVSVSVLILCVFLDADAVQTFSAWGVVAFILGFVDIQRFRSRLFQLEQRQVSWFRAIFPLESFSKSVVLIREHWLLGISLIFGALFVYVPNFFLQFYSGTAAVGEFAAVSYFLIAGGVIINSCSQVVTPKLARLVAKGEHSAFLNLTIKLCFLGASIGLIGVLVAVGAGEFFLRLFYNDEIAKLSAELVIVLVASAIRYIYIFIGTSLNAIKAFNQQTYIYALGVITLALSCGILVPEYGTLGAAWAMVSATVVELIAFALLFYVTYIKK